MPDEATRQDFEYIAQDDELYQECKSLFDDLYTEYHEDGLYKPSSSAYNFAKSCDRRLALGDIEILN